MFTSGWTKLNIHSHVYIFLIVKTWMKMVTKCSFLSKVWISDSFKTFIIIGSLVVFTRYGKEFFLSINTDQFIGKEFHRTNRLSRNSATIARKTLRKFLRYFFFFFSFELLVVLANSRGVFEIAQRIQCSRNRPLQRLANGSTMHDNVTARRALL